FQLPLPIRAEPVAAIVARAVGRYGAKRHFYSRLCGALFEDFCLHLLLYVGALDTAPLSLRPADAPGLDHPYSAGHLQHPAHRRPYYHRHHSRGKSLVADVGYRPPLI
nr:hypothetical protein [Tanacetum cinerariifolium]